MIINHSKTAELCRLLNQAEVARQCNTTPPLVHHVINGTYLHMDSPKAVAVIELLRRHNCLVEEEAADQAA